MPDALERLYRRILMAIGRGRITLVDDSGKVQLTQVKLGADEVRDAMPRLAEFGFTSNPPTGADAVAVFLSGDRSNGVIIATGHQAYRLSGLASGDSAQFDSRGQHIWLTPGGIVIDGAGLPMTINNVPTITQHGDFHVTGAVIAGYGGADQVGVQTHKHTQGVDGHGDTEVPTDAPTAGT